MAIDVEKIKQLREETGAGVLEIKSMLEETGGDFDKAKEELMKKAASDMRQKMTNTSALKRSD